MIIGLQNKIKIIQKCLDNLILQRIIILCFAILQTTAPREQGLEMKMKNYMPDTQEMINRFAELNSSELAQEFATKLGKQLSSLLNSKWDSRKEVDNYVFENDMLEKTCDESECDFDWNAARDLQRDMVVAVSECYRLNE